MFCEKCKKKSKSGDIYCTECGNKLLKEKHQFKISKKTINILLSATIVSLILFLTYNIVSYLMSPNFIATKYFKTLINNDIEEIYSYIDYKSDFVSKELLENKIEPLENVENYKITNIKIDDNKAIVEFNYEINNEQNIAYVSLKRSKNKYFIFDEYKIDSGKIVTNITFKVPKNSKIIIDSKEINKYLINSKNEYFDIYEIPYMIKGNYEIKTELNGIIVEDEIEVVSNQTYSINNIELEDELESNLKKIALDKISYIYNNALIGKTFDEVKSNFKLSDYDNLEETYKTIRRGYNNTSYMKINNFEFIEASIKRITYSEEGKLLVTLDTDYNVNGTIKLQEQKEFSNKDNSYIKVTFDYVDGNYDVYDISANLNVRGW